MSLCEVELKDFKTNLEVTAKQMKAKAAEEKKASKKGAGPAAAGGTAAAEAAGPSASAGTGEYWQMVQSDIAKILKHFGDDFAKKPALAIEVAGKVDQGGIQAGFGDASACKYSKGQGGGVSGQMLSKNSRGSRNSVCVLRPRGRKTKLPGPWATKGLTWPGPTCSGLTSCKQLLQVCRCRARVWKTLQSSCTRRQTWTRAFLLASSTRCCDASPPAPAPRRSLTIQAVAA